MTTPSTLIGKAAVLKDLDSGYEVVDKQAPSPERGEALVQLNFSGCCYTDTQARFPSPNEPPPRRPHIGGHIPAGLSDEQAAPLMCGGATVFSALLTSGVTAGQWVAIPGGGGGLGHLAIQYAKAMGARVVAIDIPTKERFCRETCGADEFVDATSASLVEEVVRITAGGPHVSIVTSYRAYESAFNFARVRGVVMLVAMGLTQLDTTVAVIKGLRLIGTSTASRALTTRALEVAARAGVKASLEIRALGDVERTMVDLREGRISGRVVIDMTL